jgi:hypothetical protein
MREMNLNPRSAKNFHLCDFLSKEDTHGKTSPIPHAGVGEDFSPTQGPEEDMQRSRMSVRNEPFFSKESRK